MDELTEQETAFLDFERQWGKYSGAKESAIREAFDMTSTRYHQVPQRDHRQAGPPRPRRDAREAAAAAPGRAPAATVRSARRLGGRRLSALGCRAVASRQRKSAPPSLSCEVRSASSTVELRGFEPLTFSLRTRRATNCATAPGEVRR
jgi:Protein of unknown function (DUF3263)